jgi:hypothetical protein
MSASEVRTVTIREAKKDVRIAMRCQRPVMLWGPPGIGKSDLAYQLAEDMGGALIDLRLPLLDPTDLKGMPYFDTTTGSMRWASPSELPSEEFASKYPIVILFLDEMNAAAPAVQASAYQLTLNRRIGEYRLPKNVVIMAAGNRESDRGVTYRMPAPLANRFIHLELRCDFDSWNEWAVNKKTHSDVVGYLNFAKQDLFDMRPESASRAFATPRTWMFVSELLSDPELDDSSAMDLICGAVGEGLAVKFMAHRKFASQLPNPSDVLAGKVSTIGTKEVSAHYSLTISMCYELKDYFIKHKSKPDPTEWHEMVDNFFRFIMDNFSTEICILAVKVALQNYGLVFQGSKMKTYNEFAKKYGTYITAAMQAK